MTALPKTKDDWIALVLFPFKAYVIMGLPFLLVSRACWHAMVPAARYYRATEATLAVSEGYALSLLVLLVGALLQSVICRRGCATQTLVYFGFGVIFFWQLWPWGLVG